MGERKRAVKQIRRILLGWYCVDGKGPSREIWEQVIEPLLAVREREIWEQVIEPLLAVRERGGVGR